MIERLRQLRARLRHQHDRLRSLPLWFRLPLHVALVSLFALGPATRIAYWLVVGTMTEAWPWQLWGEPYLGFIHSMLNDRLPQVYILLCVAGFSGIGWWLRSHPKKRSVFPRLLMGTPQLAMILVGVASMTVLSPLLAVNSVRLVRNWPPRTDHLIQKNCGHCHSPYRPQHYIKPPEMWRRTVQRMIERNKAPVSDADAEKIIAWLQDYRAFSDGWMFRGKCERCHHRTHLLERDRTSEEWAWVVKRLEWVNGFAYRQDQQNQIRSYLSDTLSVEPPPEGTPEREALDLRLELQDSCNPCHSLSLVLEEGALDDPRGLVERMSLKNPTLVPEDRIDALTKAVEELPTDEDAFWELFPHDILLELGR